MLVIQFRLIPPYRRLRLVRLLGIFVPFRRCRHLWRPLAGRCAVRGGTALAGVLTAGFALLAARTVTGLIHGTFLSRAPAAACGPGQASISGNRPAGPRAARGWHGA
jgi:hypothetical protein